MTEAVLSLGVGLGLAAATGLRVFLPMLLLGIAARLGLLTLGSDFEWIASNVALGGFGAATILEIAAYYVPWLDNALDAAAGPLAIGAGVLMTAAVTADLPPAVRWGTAIVAGGGTAGIVQGVTSLARLKSSVVTGGLANPVLATLEWTGALIASIIAVILPALALAAVVVIVAAVSVVLLRARRRRRLANP